jgi:hypothetical protein
MHRISGRIIQFFIIRYPTEYGISLSGIRYPKGRIPVSSVNLIHLEILLIWFGMNFFKLVHKFIYIQISGRISGKIVSSAPL